MNSTLKLVLPIGLVALVVFVVTFVSSNTPSVAPKTGDGPGQTGPLQPLRLSRLEAKYDPESDDPAERFSPGVYEPGPDDRPATFWFQNVNPVPVRLTVLGRSCTACTSARVATLPRGAVGDFVSRRNVGLPPVGLPLGPMPVPDLAGALAAAALIQPLPWKEFDFQTKDESAEVAAGSPDDPTWGVFQFGVQLKGPGPVRRSVDVGLRAGGEPEQKVTFFVRLIGISPFRVTPEDWNVGEVAEDGSPRQSEVICWSATRGPADFPKPDLRFTPDDPLLAVGEPVALGPAEVQRAAVAIGGDPAKGSAPPIRAAWRVPVTVLPGRPATAGGPVPDIGPFERVISVLGPGPDPGRVKVRGTVTGLVSLKDGTALKFGQIDGREGASQTVTLVSQRADLDLEPVPSEFKPVALKVDLGPASTNGPRREWTMKVTVPADGWYGPLPEDAAVVLKTTGPNPRRVRIPVQGNVFRRS